MFEPLLGNEPIKAYLRNALEQNRLPHALLFAGIDGVGKTLFATTLAAALLRAPHQRIQSGNHPDFHSLVPEGKSGLHSIESCRALIDEVHAAPFEAPGKVFLIHNAERMQSAAANALLKTLEEPNPDTTLILLSASPADILPTILSRCIRLSFQPLAEQEIASLLRQRGHPETFAKRAQGSIGRALDQATRPSLEEPLFHLLYQKPPYPQLADALEKLEELAEDDDPVRKSRNMDHLLSALFMWCRDQHARLAGVADAHLFYPDQPPASYPVPPLETVQKSLAEARLALSRNMKFSVCLMRLFDLFPNAQ